MRETEINAQPVPRRAGRPRAIPQVFIPEVMSLYRQGLGYRAVARELGQHGISVDWSTVRRVVKGYTEPGRLGNAHEENSDTILTLAGQTKMNNSKR